MFTLLSEIIGQFIGVADSCAIKVFSLQRIVSVC